MLRILCIGAVAAAFSVAAFAADPIPDDKAIQWQAGPPGLPPGAEFAVLSGDPGSNGLYVVRAKLPAGYKIPAHSHPTTEYVTVLSGELQIGMGDKLDASSGQMLQAGGFAEAPAKMNHYAWSGAGAVIQVHGQGPFEITYVNPDDDPRTQTSSKPQ
ncbi:MAG: cupin domain-containing protein [Gemmatimonas sp.]